MTRAEALPGAGLAILIVAGAALHMVLVGLLAGPGWIAGIGLLIAASPGPSRAG